MSREKKLPESEAIDYDIPSDGEEPIPEPPVRDEDSEDEDLDDMDDFKSKRPTAIDPNRKKRKKRNNKIPIIISSITGIACIVASMSIFLTNYASGAKESDKIPSDLTKVAAQVDKAVKKADNPDKVTGANCFIGDGITDFADSTDLKHLFGGSSMKDGNLVFQIRYDKKKPDVHNVKITPETCVSIYPLNDKGKPDQQKGDAIKNGYYIFGSRVDSNNETDKLMVYSSKDGKILDDTYNILEDKFN